MFRLGEKMELVVAKTVEFGLYLEEKDSETHERVLLPQKYVPENIGIGDSINVFIYKDSSDRIISTTLEPKLTVGKPEILEVVDVNKNGAYLDFGLEKDLFLPFKQQTKKVSKSDKVLVAMYVDKTGRLAATMNVYKFLRTDSPYKTGDDVEGTVYEDSDNYGMFVAVDNMYSAIIPLKEEYGNISIGDTVKARITGIREDGKINLSVREKSHIQMFTDMEKILVLLDEYQGVLPFTEKASKEVINRECNMSKAQFKRAVGHLYKERKIEITEEGKIRKI